MDIGGSGMISDMAAKAFDQTMQNVWNANQMALSRHQFKTQKDLAYHPYSIAVKDLEKAGINPILAARGGLHTGGMPSASGAVHYSGSGTNFASSAAALQQAKIAKDRLISERKLLDANAKLANEKEFTEAEMQHKLRSDRDLNEKLALKAEVDASTSSAQGRYLNQEALRESYENYRRAMRAELYKGKSGKILTWVEWILDQANPIIPKPIIPIIPGGKPKK